jgi:4-amino-4-deoxy-L-arabinose transferase-like glycosyltransferase
VTRVFAKFFSHPIKAAVIVICLFSGLLIFGIQKLSPTFDEGAHFLSGLDIITNGDTSYYYTNPPLIKSTAATLSLLSGTKLHLPPKNPKGGVKWISRFQEFMHLNGTQYLTHLNKARLITIFFYFISSLLLFYFSFILYGIYSAWISFLLWSLCPVVLGFSNLLTSDVPICFFFLLTMYLLVRWHESRRINYFILSSLSFGLGVTTKFSMFLFLPPMLVYLVWSFFINKRSLKSFALYLSIFVLIFLLVVNAVYLFNSTPTKIRDLTFHSKILSGKKTQIDFTTFTHKKNGNIFANSFFGEISLPLPKDFIKGFDEQLSHENAGFMSYMNGKWGMVGGWYSYYLFGTLVKMPEVFFVCLFIFLFLLTKKDFRSFLNKPTNYFILGSSLFIFLMISLSRGLNSHYRYVLPSIFFLVLILSSIGNWIERKSKTFILFLLFLALIPIIQTYPRSISYFNTLSGGAKNGWKKLIDSNFDWGQDLIALSEWLNKNPQVEYINLAFLGLTDPKLYGIRYKLAPPIFPKDKIGNNLPPYRTIPGEGWYAISGSFLAGLSIPTYDEHGNWVIVPFGGYDYLKKINPEDFAGFSISIYYISKDEAQRIYKDLIKREGELYLK